MSRESFVHLHNHSDYSLLDGELQVWEINTNPVIMARPEVYREPLLPAQERFAPRIIAAFEVP